MKLPWGARLYLWGVVAAGVGVWVLWVAAWRGPLPQGREQLALMALLFVLAVVAQHFPLPVTPNYKVNAAVAVYLSNVLLFGAPAAVALTGVSLLAGGLTLSLRRHPVPGKRMRALSGVVFNAGQGMVSVGVAGAVYFAFGPHTVPAALDRWENLWTVPASAAALFLANTGLVAVIVGLQQGKNPLRIWVSARRQDTLHFAGLMPVGALTAYATVHYPWAPLMMVVPAAMLHLSLQSSLRLVQQAEELARREAEAAALRDLDRMKDELITTISHELRTPLTVIHGYASRLRGGARHFDPATVEESATRILAGSTQLSRLVSDLADFGKAARRELAVEIGTFDLAPVIDELVAGFRAAGRLRIEWSDRVTVTGDRGRVAQILGNLLDNAAKYAPEGPIMLRVASRNGTVRVEVQDSGLGVAKEDQNRVWEKFYRGARVTEYHLAQGTGIGLAVVKALVEAQGGRVGLDSRPGRGACFWFELPAAAAPVVDAAVPAVAASGRAAASTSAREAMAPAAAAAPAGRAARVALALHVRH